SAAAATLSLYTRSSTMPAKPRKRTSNTPKASTSRFWRDQAWGPLARRRNIETVALATHRFDRLQALVGVEFLAQATHEDFQHVAVAVVVLLVEVLSEFGLGDHLARMQHQVFQNLVLVRGQINVPAVHLQLFGRGVEDQGAELQGRFGK